MIRFSTAALALAAIATTAAAEPTVYINPDQSSNHMNLWDYNPGLPNIRIEEHAQGNGVTLDETFHMHIQEEPEASCSGGWEPQFYNIEAPSSVTELPYYGTPQGMLIDGATPDWFEIYRICRVGEWFVPLPRVRTQYGSPEQCYCTSGEPVGFPADELRYLPFRWKHLDSDDWYYGWSVFKVILWDFLCHPGCDLNPSIEQGARVMHIGFALESEPNTGIIVGGGLCPGDINYDSERDLFDVFDYLDLFNSMDPAADYTDDGNIDIFDVFAFLDDFQSPCAF